MYKILENNVNEIIAQLLVGYKHSDYTKECVNSQKIARYVAYEQTVNKLISDIYEAGYCPHAICRRAEKIAGVDLKIIPYKHLKQSADEQFELSIAKRPVDIGRSYIEASDVMEMNSLSVNSTKDQEFEKHWNDLANIPFDEGEYGELYLGEDWLHFNKGKEREEIWHWFDKNHSKGVLYLLYEFEG